MTEKIDFVDVHVKNLVKASGTYLFILENIYIGGWLIDKAEVLYNTIMLLSSGLNVQPIEVAALSQQFNKDVKKDLLIDILKRNGYTPNMDKLLLKFISAINPDFIDILKKVNPLILGNSNELFQQIVISKRIDPNDFNLAGNIYTNGIDRGFTRVIQ
jgi:hypothetical protein